MALSYAPIATKKNKGSGVSDFFYWSPFSSFAANGIKCPPAAPTTNEESVTVADDHTFTVDNGFLKVQGSPSKNMFEASFIGEQGSLKMMASLKVFLPGSEDSLHAAISLVMNEPLIVLVKDSNCADDFWYQLGCDCAGAYIAPEGGFKSGTNADGVKGYEITIKYPTNAVLKYTGAITEPSLDTGNPVV